MEQRSQGFVDSRNKNKEQKRYNDMANEIDKNNDEIIIYQTADGQTQIDVRMENETVWLTRQQIAVLFGRDYKTISKHINNALKEELADSVVVARFANTTQHGAIEGKTQTHELDYFGSTGFSVS